MQFIGRSSESKTQDHNPALFIYGRSCVDCYRIWDWTRPPPRGPSGTGVSREGYRVRTKSNAYPKHTSGPAASPAAAPDSILHQRSHGDGSRISPCPPSRRHQSAPNQITAYPFAKDRTGLSRPAQRLSTCASTRAVAGDRPRPSCCASAARSHGANPPPRPRAPRGSSAGS
jgi:hypothetical protein